MLQILISDLNETFMVQVNHMPVFNRVMVDLNAMLSRSCRYEQQNQIKFLQFLVLFIPNMKFHLNNCTNVEDKITWTDQRTRRTLQTLVQIETVLTVVLMYTLRVVPRTEKTH